MISTNHCSICIDESGDLGFNKGTHWFVISAVIVRDEDEKSIRTTIKKIKERLNINSIHFVKIKEFNRRAYLVKELSIENFTIISIVVDTKMLLIAKQNTLLAYSYISQFLIERVSWYLQENNLSGDIIFSSRSTKKDELLVSDIKQLLASNDNTIYATAINNVTYKKAEDWDLLQLADVCASSIFHAYEPDSYGFRYPCYKSKLKSHLYSHENIMLNYGITFFPDEADYLSVFNHPKPCK